jgi:hypothetical protein
MFTLLRAQRHPYESEKQGVMTVAGRLFKNVRKALPVKSLSR